MLYKEAVPSTRDVRWVDPSKLLSSPWVNPCWQLASLSGKGKHLAVGCQMMAAKFERWAVAGWVAVILTVPEAEGVPLQEERDPSHSHGRLPGLATPALSSARCLHYLSESRLFPHEKASNCFSRLLFLFSQRLCAFLKELAGNLEYTPNVCGAVVRKREERLPLETHLTLLK